MSSSKRKVPMRKCVATQTMLPKKELVRVVRTTEGNVELDVTGKKNGRGAYISKDEAAVLLAQKKNLLGTHLKAEVPEEVYSELLELAQKEKRS